MSAVTVCQSLPVGWAFDVAELAALQTWAARHGMRMTVELDHCIEGEEYQEAVALYSPESGLRRWTIWRAADAVVIEPTFGRSSRFVSLDDALRVLLPGREQPAG